MHNPETVVVVLPEDTTDVMWTSKHVPFLPVPPVMKH